jgi:tRNA(Ile)-lysidine synthase TilS/MesJ
VKREALREVEVNVGGENGGGAREIFSFDTAAGVSRVEVRPEVKSQVSYKVTFEKYCNLPKLPVDEEKFCYDSDTLRQEIYKLLDYGADESRICKKVMKANPDFCRTSTQVKLVLNEAPRSSIANNHDNVRGVIYE